MTNSHRGLNSMTKEEQVEELVEFIIESWDMSALLSYATENLTDYYSNPDNQDDFVSEEPGTQKKA